MVNKPKHVLEAWFKELAGSRPLSQLAKKLPIFNKKEDIFVTLCEHHVTMGRAAWFIKMTNAYNTAIAEARVRGRKMFDPFAGKSDIVRYTYSLISFEVCRVLK